MRTIANAARRRSNQRLGSARPHKSEATCIRRYSIVTSSISNTTGEQCGVS